MGTDGKETGNAVSEVDGPATEAAETEAVAEPFAVTEPESAPEPEAVAAGEPEPVGAPSRRPVLVLAALSAVLLIASVVLGVLFAQERSAHADSNRDLGAERARAAQGDKDLAAVRAQRTDLEAKLAAAEAQRLSPEAKNALTNCVKVYAELERVMARTGTAGRAEGSVEFMVPVAGGELPGQVCGAAEPHLAKIP